MAKVPKDLGRSKNASQMRPPRILLVDDHALVRSGVAALLQMDGKYEVIGEADNGQEAIRQLQGELASEPPDVVILDVAMPRMDGLETMRRIHKDWPQLAVMVLSMHNDEQFVAQALHCGAKAYLLKHAMNDELFEALKVVLQGERYITPAIDMSRVESQNPDGSDLTSREREVLQLVSGGHTTQAVADILNISHHTVTRHRANLMQKLHVHNQVELMHAAISRGLVVAARQESAKNV